jgi:hypothetical protein
MKSDFEGEVASPLSRFRPRTGKYILVLLALFLWFIGQMFYTLQSTHQLGRTAAGWSILLPTLPFGLIGAVARSAHGSEQEGGAESELRHILIVFLAASTLLMLFYLTIVLSM